LHVAAPRQAAFVVAVINIVRTVAAALSDERQNQQVLDEIPSSSVVEPNAIESLDKEEPLLQQERVRP
jgi:mRNA-degrading endonuclease toxin of MazEF toxin-antitoxin module